MSLEEYRQSVDQGASVLRFTFRTGPNQSDVFTYTDGPESQTVTANGRKRVYISFDRSISMADHSRFDIAQDAVLNALAYLREQIVAGETYDIAVQQFADTESRRVMFGADVAFIDSTVTWVEGLTASSQSANYAVAVGHPSGWFADAGSSAPFRTWVFVTSGLDEDNVAEAQQIVAPLVNQQGSAGVGYIKTDIYPLLVGFRDDRNIRFMRNTPQFPIDVMERLGSDEVVRRLDKVRRGDLVYEPEAISMRSIKVSGAPQENSEVDIQLARTSALGQYLATRAKAHPIYVEIEEGQLDDPEGEFVSYWSGKVSQFQRELPDKNIITFKCNPAAGVFKQTGLTRTYGYGCPHVLYGTACRAHKDSATVRFAPVLASWDPQSNVLVVPVDTLEAPTNRYVGGLVEWREGFNKEIRNILNVSGTDLLLDGPILEAHDAPEIAVSLGCERTFEFCRDNHLDSLSLTPNSLNFGGQPNIPIKNPFRFVSNYY